MTRIATRTSRMKSAFRVIRPVLNRNSFNRLWNSNLPVNEIADFFGVSPSLVKTMAIKYGSLSPSARREEQAQEWQPGDPTPEEIKERAAVIRAGWTETELRARLGERKTAERWVPAAYVYDTKKAMFVGA